jgi:hypothetical protein
MRKEAGAMLSAGCIVVMLTICFIGTATAAIVPFNGTQYSWLHANSKNDGPEGDWLGYIDDTISVRNGDSMQFQNRWYNGYAGTADIRISYGGGIKYTCVGADEYVYLGLNYGNYYPSDTASVPFYATVSNCSEEPYGLGVNHQYVFDGIMYGSGMRGGSRLFREAAPENGTSGNFTDPGLYDNASVTGTPAATAQPSATPSSATTEEPAPTQGFGSDIIILLAGTFAICYFCRGYIRK